MAAPIEVLISTDSSGQLWNACVWDLLSGTSVSSYKGGGSATEKTLVVLRDDYVMSAQAGKPLAHVWSVGKRDQVQMRLVCPGRVGAMAATPDGAYCIAAVEEKIHVWQVCTGHLLAVLAQHYQRVTCIRVSDDGSHFVTAADDGLVLVWQLARVLAISDSGLQLTPKHAWNQHSLPVTDVHVGHFGSILRVATVSVDQTCRLWDVTSGKLLCTFLFDVSLSAVTMDKGELHLFVGTSTGRIFCHDLFERPVTAEKHIVEEASTADSKTTASKRVFVGHSKQISCLATTHDGFSLVSGSYDATVKVWDVASKQCLRTLTHKGAITNILVLLTPRAMLDADAKPLSVVKPFERHLHVYGQEKDSVTIRPTRLESPFKDSEDEEEEVDLLKLVQEEEVRITETSFRHQDMDNSSGGVDSIEEGGSLSGAAVPLRSDSSREQVLSLQLEVERLQAANKTLYKLAVSGVLGKISG